MTREPWHNAFGHETDDELEAAVPEEVAGSVWPRLSSELAVRSPRRGTSRPLVGALAAALALMLSLSGWLAAENHALRQHAAVASTAPIAASAPSSVGHRIVTAGELVARLSLLPPSTRVLSAVEATALLERDRPLIYALLQGPELDAVVADGLSAGEAVAVLQRLDQATPVNLGGGLVRRARNRS